MKTDPPLDSILMGISDPGGLRGMLGLPLCGHRKTTCSAFPSRAIYFTKKFTFYTLGLLVVSENISLALLCNITTFQFVITQVL